MLTLPDGCTKDNGGNTATNDAPTDAIRRLPVRPQSPRRTTDRGVIAGVHGNASGQGAQVHAQAVSFCRNHGWQGLYSSYAECVSKYGNELNGASDAGTAISVGFVVALWVAADVILDVSYGVYRLATRGNR